MADEEDFLPPDTEEFADAQSAPPTEDEFPPEELPPPSDEGSLKVPFLVGPPITSRQGSTSSSRKGNAGSAPLQKGSRKGSVSSAPVHQGSAGSVIVQQGSRHESFVSAPLQQGSRHESVVSAPFQQGSRYESVVSAPVQHVSKHGSVASAPVQQGSRRGSAASAPVQQGSRKGSVALAPIQHEYGVAIQPVQQQAAYTVCRPCCSCGAGRVAGLEELGNPANDDDLMYDLRGLYATLNEIAESVDVLGDNVRRAKKCSVPKKCNCLPGSSKTKGNYRDDEFLFRLGLLEEKCKTLDSRLFCLEHHMFLSKAEKQRPTGLQSCLCNKSVSEPESMGEKFVCGKPDLQRTSTSCSPLCAPPRKEPSPRRRHSSISQTDCSCGKPQDTPPCGFEKYRRSMSRTFEEDSENTMKNIVPCEPPCGKGSASRTRTLVCTPLNCPRLAAAKAESVCMTERSSSRCPPCCGGVSQAPICPAKARGSW